MALQRKRDGKNISAMSGSVYDFLDRIKLLSFSSDEKYDMMADAAREIISELKFKLLTAQQHERAKLRQEMETYTRSLQGGPLTDEQKQQMKLVSAEPLVPLSAADQAKLEGLIKAWQDATDAAKPDAQRAVLLALREIANANIPAAKDAFVANLNKLNAITTPRQLDQYRQLETARRNGNRPAPPNPGRGA